MKEEASLEKVLFPIPNFGRNIILVRKMNIRDI